MSWLRHWMTVGCEAYRRRLTNWPWKQPTSLTWPYNVSDEVEGVSMSCGENYKRAIAHIAASEPTVAQTLGGGDPNDPAVQAAAVAIMIDILDAARGRATQVFEQRTQRRAQARAARQGADPEGRVLLLQQENEAAQRD